MDEFIYESIVMIKNKYYMYIYVYTYIESCADSHFDLYVYLCM